MHFLLFYLNVSALKLKTALQNGKLASEKCSDDGQPANKFSWRRSEGGVGGGWSEVWDTCDSATQGQCPTFFQSALTRNILSSLQIFS